MPYQKKGFNQIKFITDKLEELKPGEVVTVRQADQRLLAKLRNLLYSYFNHTRIKPLFKLTQPSPVFFQVIRTQAVSAEVSVTGKSQTAEDFVLDHLLTISSEDEALDLIRQNLDKDLWIETLDEWRRIIGPKSGQQTNKSGQTTSGES